MARARGPLLVLHFLVTAWLGALLPSGAAAQAAPERDPMIHVVSNGWHAGIVIARADLPQGVMPEAAEFADLAFLEFGWGDREYYPSRSPTIAMAFAAGLGANPAVIHLVGLARPPDGDAGNEVVRLTLTPAGFAAMIGGIDATFDRRAGEPAERVASGLAPRSTFYAAQGRFSLVNTCNTWVARQLAAGGVPVAGDGVVTAGQLMGLLRSVPGAVASGAPP